MTKRKREHRRGKGRRGEIRQNQKTTKKKIVGKVGISKSWRKRILIGTLCSILLGIITIVGFLWQATPRLSISSRTTVSTRNPLATYFTFSNDGYLPLNDVEFVFSVNADIGQGIKLRNVSTSNDKYNVGKLNPGERTTASADISAEALPVNAEMVVEVSYKPWFLFWKLDKKFKFQTIKTAEGYDWIEKPSQ